MLQDGSLPQDQLINQTWPTPKSTFQRGCTFSVTFLCICVAGGVGDPNAAPVAVNSVTSVLFMAGNKAAVQGKSSAVREALHLEFPSFPYQMFLLNTQKAGNQLHYLQIPTEPERSTASSPQHHYAFSFSESRKANPRQPIREPRIRVNGFIIWGLQGWRTGGSH